MTSLILALFWKFKRNLPSLMQVLLYSPTNTPRLQYSCHFIFKELMANEFSIITDIDVFKKKTGIKINYSNDIICNDEIHIKPVNLLFQKSITPQPIECFEVNNNKAFFKIFNADFPFDIFAASFYLLSRYEEYLPHEQDSYGRYAYENSLAFKEGFLQLPLVNIWVKDFLLTLQNRFPAFAPVGQAFTFIPTYDIDIAYSYRHKGFLRNIGGFLKSPSLERVKVLSGFTEDPFDTYHQLEILHKKFKLKPIYFFLVALKNGLFDKNILPEKKAMYQLVQQHAREYITGLHPSWQSGDDALLLKKEKEQLEVMSQSSIAISRQHYIRFNLPGGFQRLLDTGIQEEYSMGYGSTNGFRASVASTFFWYNLQNEEATTLRYTSILLHGCQFLL